MNGPILTPSYAVKVDGKTNERDLWILYDYVQYIKCQIMVFKENTFRYCAMRLWPFPLEV